VYSKRPPYFQWKNLLVHYLLVLYLGEVPFFPLGANCEFKKKFKNESWVTKILQFWGRFFFIIVCFSTISISIVPWKCHVDLLGKFREINFTVAFCEIKKNCCRATLVGIINVEWISHEESTVADRPFSSLKSTIFVSK
jgi:hypothetical protein